MYCQNVVSVEHYIYLALVLLIRLVLSRNYSAIVSGMNKDSDYTSRFDFQSNQEEMHYFTGVPSLGLLMQTWTSAFFTWKVSNLVMPASWLFSF